MREVTFADVPIRVEKWLGFGSAFLWNWKGERFLVVSPDVVTYFRALQRLRTIPRFQRCVR